MEYMNVLKKTDIFYDLSPSPIGNDGFHLRGADGTRRRGAL